MLQGITWLGLHISFVPHCVVRLLGCFAINLDQVSLQVIFTKQIVKLLGLCPDGRSFGGQLRQYAMASRLAYVTVRGVHRRFVQ